MTNKQQFENMKQEYLNMNIPEEGMKMMKQSIERAKMKKQRMRTISRIRNIGIGMAAALAVAVALPNINGNIAYAMSRIPVIGGFFKVVTLRDYTYEDENYSAQVKIPQVSIEGGEGQYASPELKDSVDKINLDMDQITEDLIEQFKTTMADQEDGHASLTVNHEVVTDNDRWFTLRLVVEETQASSDEFYKYYTVDKQTGKVAALGDLFTDGSDYLNVLTQEIKKQMSERMSADENVHFYLDDEIDPDANFTQLSPEANFYFNSDGKLTIVFDKYDVAPGYMGTQEFVVDSDAVQSILKK